ncbi:MAG TPA: hypothetical protein PLI98_11160, partial [Candidatus Hydrogenedentes bacterium]|nr:hypothetical protein [Candidatus Hydrogenedentota bacterium]
GAFFSGVWGPLSAGIRAAVGIVGTAIQPVVAAFSAVGRAVGDVMGAFARLASGPGPGFFGALGRGIGMLGGAVAWAGGMLLRGLLAPVVLVARGVALVASGISMVVQAATWGAGVMWSVLTAPGRAILSTVRALWNGVTAGFSALWQGVSAGFRQAFAPVLAVWKESVLPAVNAIRTAWAGLFQGNGTGVGLAKVVDALKVPMQWLLKGAGLLGQALGGTLGAAVRWGLVPALEFVGGVLGSVARMVESVVQAVRGAWEFFTGLPVVKWFVEPTVKPVEQPGVTGMKVQTPQMIMEPGGLARQFRQLARPMAVGLAGLSVAAPQAPAVARPAVLQDVRPPVSVARPWAPLAAPEARPEIEPPDMPQDARPLPVERPSREIGKAPAFFPSPPPVRVVLDVAPIVEELRRVAERPLEGTFENRIVLDGREVARSVNRFNRAEQVKRYGQQD